MDALQTPILTSFSFDTEQEKILTAFIDELRKGSTHVAKMEAKRLEPYLEELAVVLAEDAAAGNERVQALANKTTLTRLFNALAKDSRNAVLSELLIVPESA